MIKWIEERRKRKRNEFIYKQNQNLYDRYNNEIQHLINKLNVRWEYEGWKKWSVFQPIVGTVYARKVALEFEKKNVICTIFDGEWVWAFCVDKFKRNMFHKMVRNYHIPKEVKKDYFKFTKDVEDLLIEMTSKVKEEEY